MKKIGYILLSFAAVLAAFGIQILVTFPAVFIGLITEVTKSMSSGETIPMDELLSNLMALVSSQNFNTLVSIAFSATCILIFGLWYSKQFHGTLKAFPKTLFRPGIFFSLLLMVPGLQMFSGILTSISATFFPSAMEFYQKLMETAGLIGKPTPLLALYAVFLGPIGEELIFRGVVFSSAKKSLPFVAANIFQAVLFGAFHLNLIQGIYAFFVGLFMGYVCHAGKSIYYSVVLHIFFNAWGTFLPTDTPLLTNPIYSVCFLFASVFMGIIAFSVFRKKTGSS